MKGPASVLLRIGLAFTFLYAALSSFAAPENWIGFLPRFLVALGNGEEALVAFSVFEVLLALWLLSGIAVRAAASVSAFLLFALVGLNLGALDILFRDVGLGLAALALFLLHS